MYITRTKYSLEAQRKSLKDWSKQNAEWDDHSSSRTHWIWGSNERGPEHRDEGGSAAHTTHPCVFSLDPKACLTEYCCVPSDRSLQPF